MDINRPAPVVSRRTSSLSNARVLSRVRKRILSIGKTFHFLDKRRSSSIPGGTCISIRFWFHVLLEHKEQESRCICPGTPPGHVVYGNTLLRNALSNFIFRRLRRRRRTLNDNSTPSWHCRVVWTLLHFGNSRDILIIVAKLSLAISG